MCTPKHRCIDINGLSVDGLPSAAEFGPVANTTDFDSDNWQFAELQAVQPGHNIAPSRDSTASGLCIGASQCRFVHFTTQVVWHAECVYASARNGTWRVPAKGSHPSSHRKCVIDSVLFRAAGGPAETQLLASTWQ